MKSAVINAPQQLQIQELAVPVMPDSGALIKVLGCGICGSDTDKLFNRQMPLGTVLGHEVVGRIEQLSANAPHGLSALQVGQRVALAHHVPCGTCHYCRHGSPSMCPDFKQSNITPGGFSEWVTVTGEHLANTVFAMPDNIPDTVASCVEPFACCLRAIDRIPKHVGQNACVIGLGFIGLMTAQALKEQGYYTTGLDLKPERNTLALNYQWVDAAATQSDTLTQVVTWPKAVGMDVVFVTTVNTKTLETALTLVRDGGILVLFSSNRTNEPILNQNTLYFREISVITSYSPSVQHLQQAAQWIQHGRVNLAPLFTTSYTLNQINQAMDDYQQGRVIKAFITL